MDRSHRREGKTFSYGESGAVGLAKGKRIIVCLARGNVYSERSPYVTYEHAESPLRSVFTFIGADVEFFVAEGLGRVEEARRTSIDGALERARGITREFTASATIGA